MVTKKKKRERKEEVNYKAKYLRALADYQNYQRYAEEEIKKAAFRAKKQLILRLLPFLDGLEKAEGFIEDEGLRMVKKRFEKILADEGLEEIKIVGKQFSPYLAEAVTVVGGEKDNLVVEVLRKGYRWHGEVIRPAQVKVSKKGQFKN